MAAIFSMRTFHTLTTGFGARGGGRSFGGDDSKSVIVNDDEEEGIWAFRTLSA